MNFATFTFNCSTCWYLRIIDKRNITPLQLSIQNMKWHLMTNGSNMKFIDKVKTWRLYSISVLLFQFILLTSLNKLIGILLLNKVINNILNFFFVVSKEAHVKNDKRLKSTIVFYKCINEVLVATFLLSDDTMSHNSNLFNISIWTTEKL